MLLETFFNFSNFDGEINVSERVKIVGREDFDIDY